MVAMKRERVVLAILVAAACLAALAALAYFLLFPSIAYFQAEREKAPGAAQALALAAMGRRLTVRRLSAAELEDGEALQAALEGCGADALLLSPAVAFHAQRSPYKKSPDGPVAMAICQSDPLKQFDVVFQPSPAAGWDEAAAYLKKRGLKAVVVVTAETRELEGLFDDPDLFFLVEEGGGSIRTAEKAARLARLNGASVVCCPYVPDFRSFLDQGVRARWIVDDSLAVCLHGKFILGTIEDDISATLRPALKAGLRHTRTMVLPLERRLVAEGGRL